MSREIHVRFRERLEGQFLWATRLVAMCRTAQNCEEAQRLIEHVLGRLGLKLHPDKTKREDLTQGAQGFDFLGCHLHKRMSGRLWEQKRLKRYYLQRWPSRKAMNRVRERVRELTPRGRCHQDLRSVIAELNPVLRGWGQYFQTGNAADHFTDVDEPCLLRKPWIASPARDDPLPGQTSWQRESRVMLRADRPLVSRVREIRTHGLNGGVGSEPGLRVA